mmetsp:Transcript_42794/g.54993  ORF Transcript_42794/g.54993 Transcript_42794/m.54993 type:complete len:306 (+) Transcript_42794:474-1391(+)
MLYSLSFSHPLKQYAVGPNHGGWLKIAMCLVKMDSTFAEDSVYNNNNINNKSGIIYGGNLVHFLLLHYIKHHLLVGPKYQNNNTSYSNTASNINNTIMNNNNLNLNHQQQHDSNIVIPSETDGYIQYDYIHNHNENQEEMENNILYLWKKMYYESLRTIKVPVPNPSVEERDRYDHLQSTNIDIAWMHIRSKSNNFIEMIDTCIEICKDSQDEKNLIFLNKIKPIIEGKRPFINLCISILLVVGFSVPIVAGDLIIESHHANHLSLQFFNNAGFSGDIIIVFFIFSARGILEWRHLYETLEKMQD